MVLLELLAEHVDDADVLLGWVAGVDMGHVGLALVAVFVTVWLVSLAIWRLGRIEDRWQAPTGPVHHRRKRRVPRSARVPYTATPPTSAAVATLSIT